MSTKPLILLLETVGNSTKSKSDKENAILLIPKLIPNVLSPVYYSNKNAETDELGDRLRYYENHIFNFYGKDNRVKAKKEADIFCKSLFESLMDALKKWPQNISNKEFFWKIILTLTNSTMENFISDISSFMIGNPEKAQVWQSMMAPDGLEFSQYENFIVKIMNVAEKPSHLTIIFGQNVCTNSKLSKFLTETVLVRRIQSSASKKRHSYLIAGHLAVVSPELLLESFAATLKYFHLQSKNTFNDFEQQKQTAITTVDLAKVIPKEWESKANQYITQFVPSSMPNYLVLSDASRRQLGMYVGETLIKLFPIKGVQNLIFEYDEEDPMLHEVREVILEPLENGELPDALKPPPPPAPKKEEEKKGPLHAKTILDSDDDEEEADQAYLSELHDYASKTRHKTNQIPLLIDKLSEKNDVKKFYSGLHDLLEYLPNQWVPVREITPELVSRVVNLENKFNLPQFQLHRQKILEIIFYRRPELISFAVRLMLSRSTEMPHRYFVLQAMIGAANYISTGKGLEEATKEAQKEMEEIKKDSAFEKFEKITVQGDERVGKLLRASQSLLKEEEESTKVEKKNLYLEYAPQFVYPLIQEEVEGLHLDFTKKEDATFLGRLLTTAGILVGFAENAPTIVQMTQNLILFIEKVKKVESEDVIESIVFCYGAIVQAMSPPVFFEVHGEDVCEWIEYLIALKESDVCDACPRLREVVDGTAGMLLYTVNTMKDQIEA